MVSKWISINVQTFWTFGMLPIWYQIYFDMYHNVSLCIIMYWNCIIVYLDVSWCLAMYQNPFWVHYIEMGKEIHFSYRNSIKIHFNKLMNSLDLWKDEVNDFDASLWYWNAFLASKWCPSIKLCIAQYQNPFQ